MNVRAFLAEALGAALETGVATSDDIVRHCTPDVLAQHLPRPLWARLITACLGAPRVDAQLIVETIGIPNLAEHVPHPILWACVAELGARALSGAEMAPPTVWASRPSTPAPLSLAPPPELRPVTAPPANVSAAPIPPATPIPNPLADLVAELDSGEPIVPSQVVAPATSRTRSTTRQPFRSSTTAVSGRRPQASAPTTPAQVAGAASVIEQGTTRARGNRMQTDVSEYEIETDVREPATQDSDEALVDWPASEETVTGGPDYDRKR